MGYRYRGIHARHPAKSAALNGIVYPGDRNGRTTPEEHNRGGRSDVSPYTSWTTNEELARSYACEEAGFGVLLRVHDEETVENSTWSWVGSPDHYSEGEWLLKGIRLDVEVIERELPCRGGGEVEVQSLEKGG